MPRRRARPTTMDLHGEIFALRTFTPFTERSAGSRFARQDLARETGGHGHDRGHGVSARPLPELLVSVPGASRNRGNNRLLASMKTASRGFEAPSRLGRVFTGAGTPEGSSLRQIGLQRRFGSVSGLAAFTGLLVVAGVAGLRVRGLHLSSRPAPPPARQAAPAPTSPVPAGEKFRPREMQFGDSWVVVSTSAFPDSRGGVNWHPPVGWKFTVASVRSDQVAVEARRLGSSDDPALTLAIDPRTATIIRSRVLVPATYGDRILDRRYQPGEPCLTDLSPVPFDRPVFPVVLPGKNEAKGAYREEVHRSVTGTAQ